MIVADNDTPAEIFKKSSPKIIEYTGSVRKIGKWSSVGMGKNLEFQLFPFIFRLNCD